MAKSNNNNTGGGKQPDHTDPRQVEKDLNDQSVTGGNSGRHNVPKEQR